MSSYYRQQLEDWLKTIDVKADRVVDIGGSANPVEKRVKSWDVKDYLIVDNCSEKDHHDKWREPDHNFDLNERSGITDLYGCDVVFCLEVFEYIWNPLMALQNIHFLLDIKGVAYISFPAIYPVHQPIEVDYMRYTKRGIEKLLEEVGFTDWNITPRVATKGADALGAFYALEKMRPVKKDPIIYDIGYLVEAKR